MRESKKLAKMKREVKACQFSQSYLTAGACSRPRHALVRIPMVSVVETNRWRAAKAARISKLAVQKKKMASY